VDGEKSFVDALHEFMPDVILSDFSMPGFDGTAALALAREICPDTPFIFVSGAIGEETAINALKSGATDYVLKSNLVRLPSAVERARAEAVARRERRRTDAQLRESESLKGAILESSLDCLITIDHEGKIVEFNPAAEATFGLTREQALGKAMVELIVPPRLRDAHRRGFAHYLATGEGPIFGKRLELEAIRADGTEFPIELAIMAIGATSKPMFTGFVRDITARKEFEEKIKRLNRVYAVLSGINSVILRAGDRNGLFRDASRIAIEHGGFRMAWIGVVDKEAGIVKPVAFAGDVRDFFETAPLAITENKPGGLGLAGRAVGEMKPMISNDVRNDPQRLMRKEMDERGINSLAVIPLIVGGEAVGVLSLYAGELGFFDSEEMKLLVDLAGNISFALEHIESEEKVRYLAYYDSLTGLANRTLFLERLAQYVSEASRERNQLALVIVNIERFKTINDTFGREAGDSLLKQVGGRLLDLAKDPNRVARVGADHFAVVVPNLKHEESLIRGLEQGSRRIDGDPYTVTGTELRISTRSGVALFPGDGDDADTLFRNAEAALKKSSSGERYLFYTKQMTERIAEKVALENKLRQALAKDEFVLYYQPKVDIDTRRMVSAEALIRWRSPELGLVPPLQFIPLLEETGLILQVGSWALKRASLDHRDWMERGLKAPRIAVNVSPIQLRQRDFVDVLKQAIIGGVAPPGIDLEITEGVVMEDIQANIEKLTAVHALGVNIAIDDFGTGYSSLGYLAKLPVQSLKIDRSFIIAMVEDPDTMTLVSTIISLAHSLRLKIVAEGVDSEDQAKHLRLLRCDEMQGYLFSKPLPRDELTALLEPNA
jgi:PAS domain S-box-containing protein/diguanylate cyclase (GGDEF)-like protein